MSDKSDVIELRNGNTVSGDILSLSTDNMSTLSIEWPAVRSVTSKFDFAIEQGSQNVTLVLGLHMI